MAGVDLHGRQWEGRGRQGQCRQQGNKQDVIDGAACHHAPTIEAAEQQRGVNVMQWGCFKGGGLTNVTGILID